MTPGYRASPALRLGKRCCATQRSHFKGEDAEARRQRRLAQVARPARPAPGLEPRSVGAPSLCYAAPPTTGRGAHTNTSRSLARAGVHPGHESPPWQGCTHRHEPLVLIQTLPVGRDEQAPVLDPARVQTRLLPQVAAHHAPRVGQKLHLHVARPQLPQQAWRGRGGAPSAPALQCGTPAPPSRPGLLKTRPWAGSVSAGRGEPRAADEPEVTGSKLSSRTSPLGSSERDDTQGCHLWSTSCVLSLSLGDRAVLGGRRDYFIVKLRWYQTALCPGSQDG